jgi:hypothetical protein
LKDLGIDERDLAYQAWRSIIEPQDIRGAGSLSLLAADVINPYSKMALGKDISHYDDLTVDDPRIRGVDFLIVKMGGSENHPNTPMGNPYIDDKFNRYVQLAYDLPNPQGGFGVPLVVYWFSGVRVYPDNGVVERNLHEYTEENHIVLSLMLKAWHSGAAWKQIKEIFFDYEEPCYWMDLPYKIEEYWVRLYHEDFRERLVYKMRNNPADAAFPFPTIPIGLYSRRSFMTQHNTSPYSLKPWLDQHPELSTWPANYPRKVPNTASVAEVRKSWLPLASWKPYALRDDGSWTYWQFAGDPDWNLYNGTPQELYKRLNFTPRDVVVPPIDPPVTVKKYYAKIRKTSVGLKLRTGPSTSAPVLVSDFRPTPRFEIDGEPKTIGSITWASLGRAYFAVKTSTDVYADVLVETV